MIAGWTNAVLMARVHERIAKGAPDDCWLWQRCVDIGGYGVIRFKGRLYKPHRLVLEEVEGASLGDLFSLHRCDNPPCCNPRHLFRGTIAENNDDCERKGRARKASKLTDDDVERLRRSESDFPTRRALAQHFGVSPALVTMILNGQCR